MKIRTVSVQGLFNEFSYELNINPDLTFVHSPNGRGKTVLMHMISSVLKGDVSYLEDIPFQRMSISFVDESTLIIEFKAGRLTFSVLKNKVLTPISADDLEYLADALYISPERLTIRKKDGHLVDALEASAQELYATIRLAKDDKGLKTVGKEARTDRNDSELEFWCKDLKAKLDFIKDAGFEPEMPSGIRFPPSRFDIMENREACEDLAYSVSEYVDRSYQLAESIIVYKDIINNIFMNKSIDVTDSGKLIVAMNNGTTLPLNKLSSGEKQLLLIFYQMLFHSTTGSIILLDEPEISLHVTWQQMLGDYFSDICRVRQIQMIVATHSPQVIHDRWDYATELVQRNA
jgi:ABC-type cobalamin/Fe3+-siderophores transport system ATPase subunit